MWQCLLKNHCKIWWLKPAFLSQKVDWFRKVPIVLLDCWERNLVEKIPFSESENVQMGVSKTLLIWVGLLYYMGKSLKNRQKLPPNFSPDFSEHKKFLGCKWSVIFWIDVNHAALSMRIMSIHSEDIGILTSLVLEVKTWNKLQPWKRRWHIGVSKNRGGPPKSMIYNGNSYWNGWFGGKTHHFRKHQHWKNPPFSIGKYTDSNGRFVSFFRGVTW